MESCFNWKRRVVEIQVGSLEPTRARYASMVAKSLVSPPRRAVMLWKKFREGTALQRDSLDGHRQGSRKLKRTEKSSSDAQRCEAAGKLGTRASLAHGGLAEKAGIGRGMWRGGALGGGDGR